MKIDSKKSALPGNSSQLLQKLKRIKKQFTKEMSAVSDSVALGKEKAKVKSDDRNDTAKSKNTESKSKDDNILRKRMEAKKAHQRKPNGEEKDAGWIIGDFAKPRKDVDNSSSTGSLLDIFGQVGKPMGDFQMGSQAPTTVSTSSTFGSGNPSMGSAMGSSNPISQDAFGSSAGHLGAETSIEDSSDAIDAKFEQIEAESQMRDEAAKVEEQVAQQKENIQREFESQKAEAASEHQMIGNAAMSHSETPDEATFQPNSDTTTEVSAQELEAQVEEAVQESLGDGQEATNDMLEKAEQKLELVQAETSTARAAMTKEAPKFSQDLSLLMEKYASSDSRSEQEMIQNELESLLDGASDGLQSQVEKVRGQLNGMFQQSQAIWTSREAAQELQVVSAGKIAQERKDSKGMQTDAEFLKRTTKKKVFQDAKASKVQALTQKPTVQKVLRDKGVAG